MSDLRRNVGINLGGGGLIITGFDRIDRDLFNHPTEFWFTLIIHTVFNHIKSA